MRFAIVGAGGVGGYFGGRLALGGHDVHFLARGPHLEAILEDGLRVESVDGDFHVRDARATSDPKQVGAVDVVIVAVKAWQLPQAFDAIRALIARNTIVLPLLNGVEAADALASNVGPGHVLTGFCRIIAEIAEPGRIRHSAITPTVVMGERDGAASERVTRLAHVLSAAGVRADVPDDVEAALWEKFMLIATWSGIGAVTRVTIGEWREVPALREMARACLSEVVAVANARRIRLDQARIEGTMGRFDAIHPASTASMQRDIEAGRPSELEAQTGAVARLGSEASVPTPTHGLLYHLLLPQERRARAR